MKVFLRISAFSCLVILFACTKSDNINAVENSLIGKWKIKQVLANDHWGAPLTWRPATRTTNIEFTSGSKFYRHEDLSSSFISVGTYTVLPDSVLKIVTKDANGNDVQEHLNYSFDKEGYLNMRKNQFEGLVGERFEVFK